MTRPLSILVLSALLASAAACSSGSSTSSSTVSAIALSPDPCAVGRSDSIHMSALATLPDGTKKDVSSEADWTTANSNTATVDSSGVVVGVNAGVTSITAAYSGATGSLDCTVGP
jgi:hypothetical protein